MLTVVATDRTGPGATRGVADLLARHAAASEQDAGCRQFLVHQALDDPARFFLYETYDSAEAFAEHRRSQHFRQTLETMRAPLLIERECGLAGYIDNTMRDGEGSFRLIPAEATDGGAR